MTKEVLFEFVEEWTEDVLPDGRLMLEVLTRLDPEHWARREPEGARQREGVGRDAQGPGLVPLPLGGSSSSILGDPTALFSDTAARFAPRPRFVRLRAYSKAAKDRSLEIEAVAIRTVAERRLGQILATERDDGRLAKHGDNQHLGDPRRGFPLSSIGVSGNLSARAAKLAEPDDVTFERDQAEWRERMADAVQVSRCAV